MRKISLNRQELCLSWGLQQILKLPPGFKTHAFEFCGSGRQPLPEDSCSLSTAGGTGRQLQINSPVLSQGLSSTACLSRKPPPSTGPPEHAELMC